MASKNGENPATRADLNGAVQSLRTELKGDIHRLAAGLVKVDSKVDKLEPTLSAEMQDNTSRILGAIDDFAKKSERSDRAAVLHGHALTEIDVAIKDHERCLKIIESSRH